MKSGVKKCHQRCNKCTNKIKTFNMARIVKALMKWAFYQLPSHFNWKHWSHRILISAILPPCRIFIFSLWSKRSGTKSHVSHIFLGKRMLCCFPVRKIMVSRALLFGKFFLQWIFREQCLVSYFADSTGYKGSLLLMVSSHASSQTRFK